MAHHITVTDCALTIACAGPCKRFNLTVCYCSCWFLPCSACAENCFPDTHSHVAAHLHSDQVTQSLIKIRGNKQMVWLCSVTTEHTVAVSLHCAQCKLQIDYYWLYHIHVLMQAVLRLYFVCYTRTRCYHSQYNKEIQQQVLEYSMVRLQYHT